MYLLRKWDYETHQYYPFISPAETLFLLSDDMDKPIDCANCGWRTVYGACYTSRTIHNDSGIGFWVCDPCYSKELEDEATFRKNHPGESPRE